MESPSVVAMIVSIESEAYVAGNSLVSGLSSEPASLREQHQQHRFSQVVNWACGCSAEGFVSPHFQAKYILCIYIYIHSRNALVPSGILAPSSMARSPVRSVVAPGSFAPSRNQMWTYRGVV